VVELAKRCRQEVDPERFGRLRTVGELRQWTRELQTAGR
jgi:hypothetical protein